MKLYYDLASPYAYLAVSRAAEVLGAAPRLQPVLVGAIFGWRGRGSWALTDRARRGRGGGRAPRGRVRAAAAGVAARLAAQQPRADARGGARGRTARARGRGVRARVRPRRDIRRACSTGSALSASRGSAGVADRRSRALRELRGGWLGAGDARAALVFGDAAAEAGGTRGPPRAAAAVQGVPDARGRPPPRPSASTGSRRRRSSARAMDDADRALYAAKRAGRDRVMRSDELPAAA